jgi:hypothetical protein
MIDRCMLCDHVAGDTPFCLEHQEGWIKSNERMEVDFTDSMSYKLGAETYAKNFIQNIGAKNGEEET